MMASQHLRRERESRMRSGGFRTVHQLAHPDHPGKVVTVPHPKKDLGIGLVKAIMKQAGLK